MPDVDAITTYFFCSGAYDTYEDADVQAWLKESDSTMDAEACKSAYAKALGKIAGRAY